MAVFEFGKKISLTDEELRAFTRIAAELSDAVCLERADFGEKRRRAIEFCDANIAGADMPTVMNMQGTTDFIATVEGVSRRAVINSHRLLTTGQKVFQARCSDLGLKGSARLLGHNVGYCVAFVAAAELAKPLHKEFGRKAFLASGLRAALSLSDILTEDGR
jgi:hypothetical protein